MDIFGEAQVKETPKAAKKEKLTIHIADKSFNKNLKDFVTLKSEIESRQAKLAIAQGAVKEESMEKWVSEYQSQGKNPGSVIISSSEASFQFIPTDGYLKIDSEVADNLKKKYGKDIVTTDTTYSFNNAMLAKYQKVLSELISNSPDIDDADKKKLIVKSEKISVSKGTIEKGIELNKGSVEVFMDEVQPIFQMKYPKLNNTQG